MSPQRTRKLGLSILCASVLTLAAACGAGSKSPGASIEAVDCDVSGAGEVTVNVLAYNSSATDPFTNAMVKSCSKEGVEVKHAPIDFAGQYQKTATTLAGGQGTYDVIEMYSGAVPRYADIEKLVPLTDLFEKYKDDYGLDEIDQAFLDGMSYDGELYALPASANVMTMVYRKDILDELGIEPPTTYDELVDAAQQIEDSGEVDHALALPLADNQSTLFEQLLAAQGQGYLDDSQQPTFDSEEARVSLQTLVDLTDYMDPQATAFDQPRVQQQLYNGKAAIAIMYSGRMADLLDPDLSPNADQFAFAPPPAIEAGGPVGSTVSVDGWSLAANSDVDPDLLFRMIASSVSTDASAQAVPAAFPARGGVATTYNTPYADAVTTSLENGAVTPPMETWLGNMQNATAPILQQAITGKISVESALDKAQSAASTALDES